MSLTPGTRFTGDCVLTSVASSFPDDRTASRAVARPAAIGRRRRANGQARHRFLALLREQQRGLSKLAGELSRQLDAAQLVIDLDRERAPGIDIRHQPWTTVRVGRDTGRITEPRVNHDVQPHGVLLPATQWRVSTRQRHRAG